MELLIIALVTVVLDDVLFDGSNLRKAIKIGVVVLAIWFLGKAYAVSAVFIVAGLIVVELGIALAFIIR